MPPRRPSGTRWRAAAANGLLCAAWAAACGGSAPGGEHPAATGNAPTDAAAAGPAETGAEPAGGEDAGADRAPEDSATTGEPPLPVASIEAGCAAGETGLRVEVGSEPTLCVDAGADVCCAPLAFRVRNCAPGPVVLLRLEVRLDGGGMAIIEPSAPGVRIEPGEAWEREHNDCSQGSRTEAERRVQAFGVDLEGHPTDSPAVAVHLSNPGREAAQAECRACEGTWGRWGITQGEGCICRTSDGGRECRDGAECEGPCVFDRFEEVSPGLGVPVGRCAEVRVLFGCNALIPDGASERPPVTLPARAPMICVD